MLSVTDSWVKWLWQHTEAWRIRFQVAPESVPAPICQLKNRSSDYQSQLTRSQPHEGLLGRGKAQSNTNKHEDQQMTLSQSLYLSLFFLNLTIPLSVLHRHLLDKPLFCLISCIFPSKSLFFSPWFPLSPPFVPWWFSSECDMQLGQVFSSPPHSCHYTPSMLFHSHCNWRRRKWENGPWFHTLKLLIASRVLAKGRCMWVESVKIYQKKRGRRGTLEDLSVANVWIITLSKCSSHEYSWPCFQELHRSSLHGFSFHSSSL